MLRDVFVRFPMLRDVAKPDHGTAAVLQRYWRGGIRDRNQRSVLSDEPIVVHANRLTTQTRTQRWALRGREHCSVRSQIVNRVVAGSAEQLSS